MSIALVDGISRSDFRNRVRTELTYVEGWKKQPNADLRRMIDQAEAWKIVQAHGSSSGSSGCAACSGVRQEKKQSAKGLTCHTCSEVGHIQRNYHKGRSQGSAPSAHGDSVPGGRQDEGGRGKGRGRGSHGRGGRGGSQAAAWSAAGACASAVVSSAATLGGGGAAADSSGQRSGLCMWEVLEIWWGVLEWIARNPSARQDPCLVYLLLVRRLQRRRLHIRRRGSGGTPIPFFQRQVRERSRGVR